MPLTAGRYAPAGKMTGWLGGPPDSATAHARTGPCMPCWNWKSHTRPGAAAGTKNGVGPSTRGCPVRSSAMAVATPSPAYTSQRPACASSGWKSPAPMAGCWLCVSRPVLRSSTATGPQHCPKPAGHISSVVPMLRGIGPGAAACRAATCDPG